MGGHSVASFIARGYWTRLFARAVDFEDPAGHALAAPEPVASRSPRARSTRTRVSAERLFLVSCRHCRLPITMVPRVGHEDLDALLAHVRSCRPNEAPRRPAGRVAILRHFHVWATEGSG